MFRECGMMIDKKADNLKKIRAESDKMRAMPISRLVLDMAIPLALSLMVQALYNLIDSLFVAHLGENALAALSFAAIVQHLMSTTAAGMSVGMNAVTGAYLGKGDQAGASQAAMHGILLEIFCMLLFLLAGIFGVPAYFHSLTDNQEIIQYGVEYLRICMVFCVGIFGETVFERLLQTTGKTRYTMVTQVLGSVLNIILDGIFIFGLLGVPAMGIKGAAIATVISQCFAMGVAFWLNGNKNREIRLSPGEFRWNTGLAVSVIRVGIPSTAMGTVGSLANFMLNKLVAGFSTTAVAVFGIYNRMQTFILAPMLGINNSMVSVVAYNYGAGNAKRIMESLKWGLIYGFSVMAVATACFLFIPEALLAPFQPTEEMLRVGLPIFRIIGFTFLLSPPSQICSSLYQGLGNGVYSLIVTLSRQVLIRLPLAYFFASFGDMRLIWFCWPIAELCSDLMTLCFFRKIYKEKIQGI